MKGRYLTPDRTRRGRRRTGVGLILGLACVLSVPLFADQPAGPAAGAVIPIRGMITDIMRDSIERRLDEARAAGAATIIFEMDTPGGMVTSALDICRLIKRLPEGVRTVAWVNPDAYSAGAMISLACGEIWMSPASSIGDCAPIMVTPGGVQELGEAERAKAESPILQEFRDSAARNGYEPLLARAMVTVGEEVWWIERLDDTEQRRFVSTAEKTKLIDDPPPEEQEWKLVESYATTGAGLQIPVTQPVDRSGELLTMSQFDAVAFGFARGITADIDELAQKLELAGSPPVLDMSGWEEFAAWLNSPLVRGILLVLVLIGAYIEFQSPGLILPGATALVALAIFLAAPYAAGLADVWTILVLVLGLILLAVELFVLPGFGIAGLLGCALVLVAIIGTFVPPGAPELPRLAPLNMRGIWEGLSTAVAVLGSSVLVSIAGIVLLARYLPKSFLASGVVLPNPDGASLALSDAHADVARVGAVGVVTGDLRPGGQARFGQEIVDVHSQGEYVDAGRRVRIIRREGMHIEVRPLPDEPEA